MLAQLIGPDALVIIIVSAIVLLFGGAKLPKLARSLGSASHEFQKGVHGLGEEQSPTSESHQS